jgi:hypothetical protein
MGAWHCDSSSSILVYLVGGSFIRLDAEMNREHGAVLLLIFLFYSSLPCRRIIYPARCRGEWEHGAVLLLIFLFYFFFNLLLDNLSLNLENLHVLNCLLYY